eukprot:COSAG04_NODE_23962_length_329_cov_0.921739_1_plen_84_part_01
MGPNLPKFQSKFGTADGFAVRRWHVVLEGVAREAQGAVAPGEHLVVACRATAGLLTSLNSSFVVELFRLTRRFLCRGKAMLTAG